MPWFRQNYLGEWVVDDDARCYKFSLERNAWGGVLPAYADARGSWHYVLAIDLGYHPDPTAFAVLTYHDFCQDLYVLETWKQWRMDITDVANKVREFEERYSFDVHVVDGANKQAVEEMRRRHALPLVDADKRGKADFIELMNAEFAQGRIKVHVDACNQGEPDDQIGERSSRESLSLIDEYAGLVWDPRKLLLNKREEHPGCPNHLCDAVLYGWRHCYQYPSQAAAPRSPVPYSPEWFAHEADRMHQQEIDELLERTAEETVGLGNSENWEPWAL